MSIMTGSGIPGGGVTGFHGSDVVVVEVVGDFVFGFLMRGRRQVAEVSAGGGGEDGCTDFQLTSRVNVVSPW